VESSFLIESAELKLRFRHAEGRRELSYKNVGGEFEPWREKCKAKLAELLAVESPPHAPGRVTELRQATHEGVVVKALVMEVGGDLTVPAYLLEPATASRRATAVMAIHGHSVGKAEGPLGLARDGYNAFALELAKAGFVVLLPIHRGFGVLRDISAGRRGYRLDYEQSMHFSYVMDAFVRGRTVVGENVDDLLRWENWLTEAMSVQSVFAAGLSYGGDLALAYPVFSERVERIFASGSSGSFALHFCRCYNGPAHCVPGICDWMERSDVAGLNAPRPLAIHYGEMDTPCLNEPGGDNYAAAYNEGVPSLIAEAEEIYAAAGAEGNVRLIVTPGAGHALDVQAMLDFFE